MRQRGQVLADDLSVHLRNRVLAGEYQPGDSISETGIAAEYGVARPSARSALDRLVFDGLLVRQAHAALKVRRVDRSEIPELLSLLEFFERSAVDVILRGEADLRTLRQSSAESLPKFFHSLVVASDSERLIQFHRQSMFAFLMVPGNGGDAMRRQVPEPIKLEPAKLELTDALFRIDCAAAEEKLSVLWQKRAAEADSVSVSSAQMRS